MGVYSEHLTMFHLLQCVFTLVAGLDCSVQTPGRRVWIESSRILNKGRANRLTAVFCTHDPVWIQLWVKSGEQWTLVWNKSWHPASIGVREYLNLRMDEYIDIGPEHRLGLAPVDEQILQISVRKLFNSTFVQLLSSDEAGPYQVNMTSIFRGFMFPGTFEVDFCNSNGCPELDVPDEAATQRAPCQVWSADGKVKLETHRPLPTGKVKAIRTRFCEMNPVNVQIWDGVESQADKYQLVWQKTVYPVLGNGEEIIIPLKPEEVLALQSSYRLGLQSRDVTSNISVPYGFSADSTANIITSSGTSVSLCDEMLFGDIPYPMEFAMSFCYDTGAEGVSASVAKTSGRQSTVYIVSVLTVIIACY